MAAVSAVAGGDGGGGECVAVCLFGLVCGVWVVRDEGLFDVQARREAEAEAEEGRMRCSSSCGRRARGRSRACRRSGRRSTTSRRATSSR